MKDGDTFRAELIRTEDGTRIPGTFTCDLGDACATELTVEARTHIRCFAPGGNILVLGLGI